MIQGASAPPPVTGGWCVLGLWTRPSRRPVAIALCESVSDCPLLSVRKTVIGCRVHQDQTESCHLDFPHSLTLLGPYAHVGSRSQGQ